MLVALDVALLLPPPVAACAIELSAALAERESAGLRLGGDVLPHVTLTQQFVPADDVDLVLDRVASTLAGVGPLHLTVAGPGRGRSSVWMAIAPAPALNQLHQRLMDALHPLERQDGTTAAFLGGDARPGDVEWVASFRRVSSHAAFRPHVTLGHARALPDVEPLTFEATIVAACHLGKFCTCRQVLRQWKLEPIRSP
jgi:2'-5' RNA ligase